METMIKTPVLIVGGGPVGLSMAIELGWRGIESMLVDEGDGTIEHPRTGQQYARRAAVFSAGGFVIVISCRNVSDRFGAGAFAVLLSGLEVKR